MYEQEGLKSSKIAAIILVVVFAFVGVVHIVQDKTIDEEKTQSLAHDYDSEIKALIDKSYSCKSIEEKQDLKADIEDLNSRINKLKIYERDSVDKELYNKLLKTRHDVIEALDKVEKSKEKIKQLNEMIESYDLNQSIEKNNKIAAEMVKLYYQIPKDGIGYLENRGKFYDIEDAYYVYCAKDTIKLIDKIGKVKYTDKCKKRIVKACDSYYKLSPGARNKVTNYDALAKKKDKYQKLEMKELGYYIDLVSGVKVRDTSKSKKEKTSSDDEEDDDYDDDDETTRRKTSGSGSTHRERNVDPDDYDDGGDYADDAWGDDYDDWDDAYEAWEDEGW